MKHQSFVGQLTEHEGKQRYSSSISGVVANAKKKRVRFQRSPETSVKGMSTCVHIGVCSAGGIMLLILQRPVVTGYSGSKQLSSLLVMIDEANFVN